MSLTTTTPEVSRPTQATENNAVPFLNLKKLYQANKDEYQAAISRVLDKGAYIGGEELAQFEKNFGFWVAEGSLVTGCANGTDAITLAAEALNLPPGSEAIVPAMTYIATAAGLMRAGLKVNLVDVSELTWLMDVDQIEKAITPKTKLIAPVHLYGQMAAMDEIRRIANLHNLYVLEDAAQAHGASWKGKPVGYWGNIATYSFYPGKNLGAFGDGGAILTRDADLLHQAKLLLYQGGLKKYEHLVLGYNSRLDNLQAAILNVKLKHIDEWNQARRNVARQYRELLSGIRGLQLPVELDSAKHVYHLYVVCVEHRQKFMDFLKEKKVDTGIHYPLAIHQLPAFAKEDFALSKFPQAEKLATHGVSLPMCPTLTQEQVKYVATQVRAFFA